ncbi:PAN2-PAN3 deadenylation complex subunit PAN3 isoform X2 [Leptidea sinapis]|uniref:PAN2-PAN3 deadenylation complex subunit PAN3 isoform X2 n=1 Tax=Leptidea sinapis TaxID=189913 RepID=UPI00213266DB|nr:PAN2-PAN3 deadenylation complex subunit PAN3 isoform X2 [Leptidea sinapis]
MDPQMYMQPPPLNTLPQESKLVAYRNHNNNTPSRALSDAFSSFRLSPVQGTSSVARNVFVPEYPTNYYGPGTLLQQSNRSPPPVLTVNSQQVIQENVGGTTYFYQTNESVNPSGVHFSSSTTVGGESERMGAAAGYSSQFQIQQALNIGSLSSEQGETECLGASTSFTPQLFQVPQAHNIGTMSSEQGEMDRFGNRAAYASQNFQFTEGQKFGSMSTEQGGTDRLGATSSFIPQQLFQVPQTHNMAGGMSSEQGLIRTGPPYPAGVEPTVYYTWSVCSTPQGLRPMFYMPEAIRAELFQRNEELYMHPNALVYPDLPENIEMYSELIPLETLSPHLIATSYKATHRQSSEYYAIRRLHSYATKPCKRFDLWKNIDHPNVIRLNEYFTTKSFGDNSMVLVYDYHPGSVTLMNKYLIGASNVNEASGAYHDPFSSDPDAPRPYSHQKNAMLRAVACGTLLPEAVIWSILVQLTAAIRTVHTAGLACRTLDPTKVVMTGYRVRIAWCGVADALHPTDVDIYQAQQDDLTALGHLALYLACRTVHCENLVTSIELVNRTYSQDLKHLIVYLLSPQHRLVTDLMPMIGARFYTQIEAFERRADVFDNQMAKELDNGRLLRILFKFAFINERPEFNNDLQWAETGNRYLLKLFRDYMFHAVSLDGRPWMDYAHIVYCLNQLDSGTSNKVDMLSRDGRSILVVTFAELKYCLEQTFDELMNAAAPLL